MAERAVDVAGPSAPWGRFVRELVRRRRVRAALWILGVLYTLAIYAPLIANDRPYRIESASHREYNSALRSLRPITLALCALLGRAADGDERARARSLADEHAALRSRTALLREHLQAEDRELVEHYEQTIDRVLAASRAGRPDEAQRSCSTATALAERIQTECLAQDPARPERGGQALALAVRYPLFESLSASDVFFMLLWACVLTSPWWGIGFRRASKRRGVSEPAAVRIAQIGAVVGLSLAGALVWRVAWGAPKELATSAYKHELTHGDRVAERACFPPLPMGYAETHPSETYRPPTWSARAEISEQGYYVRSALAEQSRSAADLPLEPRPVDVLYAEPARNSGWRHPLGTDSGGRDLLARCLWGARTSLSVGLVAALCLCAIGVAVGAVAGYCGGFVDACIARVIEVVLCFPAFFLILMGAAVCDPARVPPLFAVVVVITLVGWTGIARLVRAEFQRMRELEFVQAARALGFTPLRIVLRHMLPNALGPVLVALAFAVAAGILTESALSFLGFGVQEPVPSWGSILNDSHSADHWWIQVFPGLFIFATVLAYNLLGEGIRDALDPRLSR